MIHVLVAILDLATLVASVVLALLLLRKGPTRQLKIALLVLFAAFALLQAVKVGPGPALALVGTILAANVVVMMATTVLLRHPARKVLELPGLRPWPRYAVGQVEEHARAFESLGFQPVGDRTSPWRFLGRERQTFIRFLKHPSGHHWAEIHALDNPKVVARMIASSKQGGVAVLTCDKEANQEFFRDPLTRVQRVASASSASEMLRAHEALSVRVPGSLEAGEPMVRHVEQHDRWVQRLVASGQVVLRGDDFVIPLRRAFPAALRVMGAWLH
jgi:hypothetical protein